MLGIPLAVHDARSEAPGGIQRASGVVDPDEFADEQGEADSDGRDEGSLVFLLCKHEYGKDELSRQECLNKEASCGRSAV